MKKYLNYYKVILWSFVIAYLCFAPASEFKNVHISIPHFDKVVHFGMFFILGLLIGALEFVKKSKFHKFWLPVLAIMYGGIIEIIQLNYIYKRNGDFLDWMADILGLFIALWIVHYLPKNIKKLLT